MQDLCPNGARGLLGRACRSLRWLVDRFVPDTAHGQALVRYRTAAALLLLGFVGSIFWGLWLTLDGPHQTAIATVCFVGGALQVALLLLLRHGHLHAVATLLMALTVLSFAACNWVLGGFTLGMVAWEVTLPLVAAAVAGTGVSITVLAVLVVKSVVLALFGFEHPIVYDEAGGPWADLFGIASAMFVSGGVAWVYRSVERHSYVELTRTLDRLQTEMLERAQMEVQLRQAQKLEAIGQLAAGVAHEINTPTQYVADNNKFLEDAFADLITHVEEVARLVDATKGDERYKESVALVVASAEACDIEYLREEVPRALAQSRNGLERVAAIVQALKTFSHPGTESKTCVDINHYVEASTVVCRNEWKYVAEVTHDLDPELPPVPCYPGEMSQVFLNLVVNAAHAIGSNLRPGSDERGHIVVRTRKVGDSVEISVSDDGPGIPQALREKVFEPFFTTKEVGKGTGQGLAIVHHVVVDKHGGTVDLDSHAGEGTTFTVRIPLGSDGGRSSPLDDLSHALEDAA